MIQIPLRHFGEPVSLYEKSVDELIRGGQALHNQKPYLKGRFGKVFREQAKLTIPEDEILLFTEDREHRIPVTLKIGSPPKSFALLAAAVKGSGKSVWVKTLMDQLHLKGYKFLCIEQKGYDFVTMNQQQNNIKFIETLNKFGLKPKGYKIEIVVPSFIADNYTKAKTWKMDVSDLASLPKVTQISTWCQFLGVKEMAGPGKALQRVLQMRNGRGPRNIKEMIEFVKIDIEQEKAKRKQQGGSRMVSTGLLYALEQKIITNEMGRGENFNFVKAIAENDIVVLNCPLDSKNLISMGTYITVALNQIISDRNIYVKTNGRKGLISQPVCVVVEEADGLIPSDEKRTTMAKHILYQIPARYRHIGISLFLITQNASLIDQRFLHQSDYIAGTQVNTDWMRDLLRIRGVPRYTINNDLAKLEWSLTDYVKQWFVLEPDKVLDPPRKGYPIPSCTIILKEGEGIIF